MYWQTLATFELFNILTKFVIFLRQFEVAFIGSPNKCRRQSRAEQRIGLNEQKQQHENLPSQFIESISICTLYANVKTLNPFKRSINIFPFFYMFLLFLLSICHQHWWKSENQGTTKTKDVKEKRNTLTEDEEERGAWEEKRSEKKLPQYIT